ncbi:thioredoxin-disulfide reductase [Candidatus Berkelbacteria bacterium CG_4_9_14_0_2_um_filter_42_30]|uniref:Thioredoxin reductase n=3 Tax=Candidatus Berkelbacteria TaxID=1618330 RepID=A0A2M7K1A9_9BACT|nr:MAG: thioredoxin-disulfide reductase [Candidatus Berkelbacteria bacterium CG11_big_fil_rev_8_21_14_0_20_42_15]PIX30057.1 MAG: thioredoxin-disulfide reductase [Candidatus Berkelbacteria bacterium CG_4_8_14_3_um_filter_42_13]PJC65716.1 MAG: thioredoxin-disulfide reductase [Candidatus Berkelbacteria bacterium CG_4_9_14_0_2_um_filter_42_30]
MKKYDVIIIGGGPAGITAAIYTARRLLKTLVITKEPGGQIVKTSDIENYPGFDLISGPELAKKFISQAKKFGAEIVFDEVLRLDEKNSDFIISGRKKNYRSKSLILAFGKVPRKLNIPGEEEFKGKGISYCSTCDAPFFKNKIVVVNGGGNSAFEATLLLSRTAQKVYLIHRRDEFTAEEIMINKIKKVKNVEIITSATIDKIEGDQVVRSITVSHKGKKRKIEIAGFFIEIGYMVEDGLIKKFVEMDEKNQIKVNKDHSTSREGVFAAGDLTNSYYKQIVISAGEGAIAALSAAKYLDEKK